jgi:hypothetical protein
MTKPLVQNSADEEQVERAGRKEKSLRDQQENDMRKVLQLREGRRFLWRYLGICKVFQTTFTGNNTTFFNEGMRDVGLRLLADINEASPESYLLMMKEAKGDEANG